MKSLSLNKIKSYNVKDFPCGPWSGKFIYTNFLAAAVKLIENPLQRTITVKGIGVYSRADFIDTLSRKANDLLEDERRDYGDQAELVNVLRSALKLMGGPK